MAIDIAKMRAKLEASKNPQARKEDSTKWKPSEGDQTLRILPTQDGDPFKEYHFHYNVGRNPGILCPKKNFGEHCPICEFASALWKEGVEQNDDNANPTNYTLTLSFDGLDSNSNMKKCYDALKSLDEFMIQEGIKNYFKKETKICENNGAGRDSLYSVP